MGDTNQEQQQTTTTVKPVEITTIPGSTTVPPDQNYVAPKPGPAPKRKYTVNQMFMLYNFTPFIKTTILRMYGQDQRTKEEWEKKMIDDKVVDATYFDKK
jgi:hypothetical protein